MFCFKCGKQIPDDSEYCLFCGVKIAKNDNGSEHIPEVNNTSISSTNTVVRENNNINVQAYNNNSTRPYKKIGKKIGKKILYAIVCIVSFFIVCTVIALVNVSMKSYDFNPDKLAVHTYKGLNTTLTMQGPFDLQMEKGGTSSEIEQILAGRKDEKNFMQDVFAVKYKNKIDNNKIGNILFSRVLMYGNDTDSRFIITDTPVIKEENIGGMKAATTAVKAYDKHIQNKRTLKFITILKENELWLICLGYPSDDEAASKFVTKMVDSIDVK
jgi:hypothetical protein